MQDILLTIESLQKKAEQSIQSAKDEKAIEQSRIDFLGKKSPLTELLKTVGKLPAAERPIVGDAVNKAKDYIQVLMLKKKADMDAKTMGDRMARDRLDVTLPGRGQRLGSLHPITQVRDRIEALFASMGFDVSEGFEVEDEWHNFEALNIPAHHPARNEQDTFYLDNGKLLRTHTSPVQVRYMLDHQPPIRMIAPGRVYRRDFDATHTPMFHQTEGLVIDRQVNFGHLKQMISQFLRRFFEKDDLQVRFRASYFPFTEPSAEADMQCVLCGGKGCSLCGNGWIEILGCGMVHPDVLTAGGIDANEFTGYAFGFGMDRIAMLYFGIPDLRLVFENDVRFLKQF